MSKDMLIKYSTTVNKNVDNLIKCGKLLEFYQEIVNIQYIKILNVDIKILIYYYSTGLYFLLGNKKLQNYKKSNFIYCLKNKKNIKYISNN